MQAMGAKQIDRAKALFSARPLHPVTKEALGKQLDGPNFALYDGYQRLTAEQFNVNLFPGFNIAAVSGRVIYEGGYEGNYQARLHQEFGVWKIDDLVVN